MKTTAINRRSLTLLVLLSAAWLEGSRDNAAAQTVITNTVFFDGVIALDGDISDFFLPDGVNNKPGVCVVNDTLNDALLGPGTTKDNLGHPSGFNQRRIMSAYNPNLNGGTIFVGVDLPGGTGAPDSSLTQHSFPGNPNPNFRDNLVGPGLDVFRRGPGILPFDADGNGDPETIGMDGATPLRRCSDPGASFEFTDVINCTNLFSFTDAVDPIEDWFNEESYEVFIMFGDATQVLARLFENSITPAGKAGLSIFSTSGKTFGVMVSRDGSSNVLGFDVEFAITNVNANVDDCSRLAQTIMVSSRSSGDGPNGEDSNLLTCRFPYTGSSLHITRACSTTNVPTGGLLVFSGIVSNSGVGSLANVVVVSDHPAPNTVVTNFSVLAPGQARSFTGSHLVASNCSSCVRFVLDSFGTESCTGTKVFGQRFSTYPQVQTHFPSGRNGGYLAGSLDQVTLTFTTAIDSNSLAANLLMDGPSGQITPTAVFQVDTRTYEIGLPHQIQGGFYNFTLLPNVVDLMGIALDQNANCVPGEPEDAYSFTLILDNIPPRVTQHAPAGDIAGTITNVDIWFSEQMDTSTMSVADVTVLNPTNGLIAASSMSSIGFNRFRITFPPQTETGQYHVLIGTNITDLAGSLLAAAYDASFYLVPVDLELTNVTPSTNQIWVGDSVSVVWQGRNTSGAPLVGNWIDAVYLSLDPFWNITDILLGTVQHTGGLASNEVYSASLPFSVPGLLPGNYYLLVRADLGNQTRETVESNNIVAFGPLSVVVRQLTVGGGGVTGTLTPNNRFHYFAIKVSAGESLRLFFDGQNGVNQFFVSFASIPTRQNSDFSGIQAEPEQGVTLTGVPGGGTYYVLVSGEQISGANPYTLSAETAPFYVTGVSPKRVSNWTSFQSDPPLAAVTITGVGFDRATSVEFIGSGEQVRLPERTRFISPTTLVLDLDTLPWPSGVYDVRVSKGATSRSQTNAFTVDIGSAHFKASLLVPSALSPGFPTRQTIWIEYQNDGNAAMVAPILRVSANQNAVLTDDLDTFVAVRSSSSAAASLTNSVQVMAAGSGATPGILQAGDRGRIPIYYLGLRPDTGAGQISVQLGSVKALEFEYRSVPNGPPIPMVKERPVDWSAAAEERAKPETVPPDAWHAVWLNLRNQLGPDWRDYVTALAAQMNHLAAVGQRTREVSDLFNFEVLQATAALNPVRTLAGAVDASAPSPGFPIVFRRLWPADSVTLQTWPARSRLESQLGHLGARVGTVQRCRGAWAGRR